MSRHPSNKLMKLSLQRDGSPKYLYHGKTSEKFGIGLARNGRKEITGYDASGALPEKGARKRNGSTAVAGLTTNSHAGKATGHPQRANFARNKGEWHGPAAQE